jgi:hypothetical protein
MSKEEDLKKRDTAVSDLRNKIRQALADEKADGLDRSEYRRRLRAEAARLAKPKQKGASSHGKSQK